MPRLFSSPPLVIVITIALAGAEGLGLPGGFFHDGRSATLPDVVNHYDATLPLGLTDAQKSDIVEYLKSI
jgi:hypothetical protein